MFKRNKSSSLPKSLSKSKSVSKPMKRMTSGTKKPAQNFMEWKPWMSYTLFAILLVLLGFLLYLFIVSLFFSHSNEKMYVYMNEPYYAEKSKEKEKGKEEEEKEKEGEGEGKESKMKEEEEKMKEEGEKMKHHLSGKRKMSCSCPPALNENAPSCHHSPASHFEVPYVRNWKYEGCFKDPSPSTTVSGGMIPILLTEDNPYEKCVEKMKTIDPSANVIAMRHIYPLENDKMPTHVHCMYATDPSYTDYSEFGCEKEKKECNPHLPGNANIVFTRSYNF